MSNESDPRIDIGLVVRDADKALAFYRDVLGLEHMDDLPRPGEVIRRLKWGDAMVKLRCPESLPSESNPGGGSKGGTGIRYFTLVMADVSATLARCVAAGHRVAMPETQTESGLKFAFVEDPEGNWIELLQSADAARISAVEGSEQSSKRRTPRRGTLGRADETTPSPT